MKKTYIKYLLGGVLLLGMPALSSCSDDDEVVEILPTEFSLNLASLNITWDETEGVVELGANEAWKAESDAAWIQIDPTKGKPGDVRLFFNFTANPYRLPRTGTVTVNCGDKSGVVTITQGGCTDDAAVAPSKADLEVASFDYETGEIDMSAFADAIAGNLGLTMAEFAQGVEDGGNLEFFMIGKDGQWLEGGTSGTKCGAWLDSDLNVTNWDGAGYPAIAAFIEVYGEEETATLVIGRAPGVPDNMEYNLKFGFTFADDHSKYTIMNVTVVFPAADLNANVVETIDLVADIKANEGYESTPVAFDAEAVCAALGAANIEACKVVSYDAEGEFIPYSANNGYWYMEDGSVGGWGEGAGWFIEYWGEDEEEPASATSFMVGPFPECHSAEAVSSIGFWYNGNAVMFNIKVTVSE